jgi:peptidoglycan/xylan/chitin deacetylase (PgdA/CDA1 family)
MSHMTLANRLVNRLSQLVPARAIVSRLRAPLASISFDDIPVSAARTGGPILEQAGVRGTYYVCGGHTNQRFEERDQHSPDDIRALHAAGHEIACHSFNHPLVTRLDDAARAQDLDANADWMADLTGGARPTSFAYPYGLTSIAAKRFYASRFQTCRGVQQGVNSGRMDFSDLKAIGIERKRHDPARVRQQIEAACARNGWIIFYTHDVTDQPTDYGCHPQDLLDVVQALQAAGVEILPVRDAVARVLAA